MAATTLTIASAMVNVFFAEAGEGEDVFKELVEEADVGSDRVFAVVDAETPLGEVVSAVFCAGSAVNPLSVQ